jgi:hypothetical protein
MTMKEALHAPDVFTPNNITHKSYKSMVPNYAHFALHMVHSMTGDTITSYKQLRYNEETAEVWQMAFGKDFGGMVQGDNKKGQKGTNSIFVMTWDKIDAAKAAGHKRTYTHDMVDYQPQKDNPNQIRIAVGGNLITYKGDTSTQTADLTTSKLMRVKHQGGQVYVP